MFTLFKCKLGTMLTVLHQTTISELQEGHLVV